MPQANRLTLPSASSKKQAENRIAWNEARHQDTADFFTVGYTGKPIGELLQSLTDNGVGTLADIRQFPVSMYRPELSKKNLQRAVEECGIAYVHCPDLGVPRDIRAKAIASGTRDVIWDWYDQWVIPDFVGNNLHRFLNAFEPRVALMCVEIDPCECHRHRLSLALESKGLSSFDL
jgi:uncharacterized protein (DUF488 family)